MIELKIRPDLDSGDTYTESNFLRIHTYVKSEDPHHRVATIEHMFNSDEEVDPTQPSWHIRTLVQAKPLTHEKAMDFGMRYAAAKKIPLIYERRD